MYENLPLQKIKDRLSTQKARLFLSFQKNLKELLTPIFNSKKQFNTNVDSQSTYQTQYKDLGPLYFWVRFGSLNPPESAGKKQI